MTKKREQIQFTKREEKCVPVSQPEKDKTGVQLQREDILGIFESFLSFANLLVNHTS